MVHHLALDDERFWFRAVMAGDRGVIDALDEAGDAWVVPGDVPAADVLELYRQESSRADEAIRGMSDDTPPAWWPDFFGDWRLESLVDVLLHVITETACHAGHLDAARELLDGRQWMVLE